MKFLKTSRLNTTAITTLPVAAVLLSAMASCSDADYGLVDGDETANVTTLEKSSLSIFTDPASMPASVLNYTFGKVGSRAIDPQIDLSAKLEEFKTVNIDKLIELKDANFYYNPEQKDLSKLVVNGEYTGQLENFGSTVFVTGKWNITGFNPNKHLNVAATIVILPGGELCVPATLQGVEALTIYNYGKLTSTAADSQVCNIEGLTLYSAANLDQIKRLGFQSEVYIDGAVKVDYIHISGNSDVYINCKLEASEEVIFDNDQTFHVGYIKSPIIRFWSNPKVELRDGAYIETDLLDIENVLTSQIYALDEDIALIKANKIHFNNVGAGNLKNTFGNINIIYNELEYGENVEATKDALGFNASVTLNKDVNVEYVYDDNGCAPIFVTEPDPDPEIPTPPSLETVATIVNDHHHPISATCIQFNGDKEYVSWHERGAGIQGCIEVVETTPEGVKLLAYAQDPNTDYNHIIFDGDRLLAVGHNAKNAIVGQIALNGGTFTTGTEIEFTNLKGNRVKGQENPEFYGGDGNCILRNGDYITVASYGGFHTLTSDLKRLDDDRNGAVATPASGKHLSLCGDKLLTLNLTDKGATTSSAAELRLYDANDYYWANPTVVATDLTITPIDGKNTIALDSDGSMYVALGHGGVRKYSATGNFVELKAGEEGKNPANGLAVDDKYLYVAYGSGLYIYNKSDLALVTKYIHTGKSTYPGNPDDVQASCNYVAVNGEYIYLAYGRDGVDVLRMINR